MGGKNSFLAIAEERGKPFSTCLLAISIPSSITKLFAVLADISKASVIGTPAPIKSPNVLVNSAKVVWLINLPATGILNLNSSIFLLPDFFELNILYA